MRISDRFRETEAIPNRIGRNAEIHWGAEVQNRMCVDRSGNRGECTIARNGSLQKGRTGQKNIMVLLETFQTDREDSALFGLYV